MNINVAEILRYLGAGRGAPEMLRRQAEEIARTLSGRVTPRYVYRLYTLESGPDGFFLPEAALVLPGQTARTMLSGCRGAALLCCTLGAEFGAMLRAWQARDMARAVILDACGSALVEAGCDAAQEALSALFPGRYFTDRFSPGYGDLPLALQRPICGALDTARRLGVHVTDSLLLNPDKSVTAILGLADRPQAARVRGCACCALKETCTLRKGGKTCGV